MSTTDVDSGTATYPGIDNALGEQAYPDEQELADAIAATIEQSLRSQYASGNVLRDAHPKAHGCVRAEFRVSPTLPPALAHGVFVPGANYPAWIRFSNGARDANRPDIKGDARGIAIKLQRIPGTSLLSEDDAEPGATQDFILISHPVFFANDPRRYLSVVTRASSDSAASKLLIP